MDKNSILSTKLSANQIAFFYLGQEGFLIKYGENYLLIDPYLSDYVDRFCCTDTVKWSRNYPAPLAPSALDFVDYVLCTHAHFDHMDPWTLEAIAKVNPDTVFVAPEPVKNTLEDYGISPSKIIGALADTALELGCFSVIPLPSAHEKLHQDELGNFKELGYKIYTKETCIYHAGDCCLYDGLTQRLADVDVLMVPINGRSFYKLKDDIIGNMTIEEAVLLAGEVGPAMMIPMHYDLYPINGVNPAYFVDFLYTVNPAQAFHMFTPGERYIFHK